MPTLTTQPVCSLDRTKSILNAVYILKHLQLLFSAHSHHTGLVSDACDCCHPQWVLFPLSGYIHTKHIWWITSSPAKEDKLHLYISFLVLWTAKWFTTMSLGHVELLPNLVVNYLGIKWEELQVANRKDLAPLSHLESLSRQFKFSWRSCTVWLLAI